jgi:HK97 family phage major capsid protein
MKSSIKEELEGLEETRKKMQEQLDEISVAQKKAAKDGQMSEQEKRTFADDIKEKMFKDIQALSGLTKKGASKMIESVKSFISTNNTSITTGSLLPAYQLDPGVSKAPDRQPFMLDLVARGFANSLTIYWVQRKTRTDGTEWVAEGAAPAAQTVLGYETKTAQMQNLSEYIKVSNNSFDDIDWLLSEVQTELVILMALKLDADILNGTVAANGFDGVNVVATAFSAGGDTLPSGVTPNKFDALSYAINQVRVAKFEPNWIVMHPSDVRDMKLTRDDQGAYMLPPTMATGMNVSVDGIRIVANTGVTKGSYLVGDFTKAKFWSRKEMDLRVWEQNEDDVLNQLKTITLYMRGTLVVKDADKLAFVKDTFADTITEITAV